MLTGTHGKAVDQYTVSVVLWGGEKPGEDPSGHIAIAIHRSTSQPKTCHLHHARCPDQVRFMYESRPEQIFDADPAPRGRCNIRSDLSAEEARVANAVLAGFGADETQLPYFGQGNCHNWTAGAVGALEKAGLAQPGDGERWTAMIGKGPIGMETSWIRDAGREWVPCEKFNQARPDVVDAKWGDDGVATRGAGSVSDFKDRVGNLHKLLNGGQG
ncbi:hypothetical protein GGR54DRAFT_555427 [Hypoxylon sp. NC1633]|nr:hypothetical protein GGR54DRAFT_555427 [Hypoxylon sp. NC1633]